MIDSYISFFTRPSHFALQRQELAHSTRAKLLARILTFIISLTFCLPSQANELTQQNIQRETFKQAFQAIKANDRASIAYYKKQLKGYVLYPYIEYLDLFYNLKHAPASQVQQFLNRYPHYRISERLEIKWLLHLGKIQDWATFNTFFDPLAPHLQTSSIQCYARQAAIADFNSIPLTSKQQFKRSLTQYWLDGKSCQAVESFLIKQNALSKQQIWHRIKLLMRKGHLKSAKKLGNQLPKNEKAWLSHWQTLYYKPNKIVRGLSADLPKELRQIIAQQVLKRLGKKQPTKALEHLSQRHYNLSEDQFNKLRAYLQYRKLKQTDIQLDTKDWLALSEDQPQALLIGLRKAVKYGDWQEYQTLYSELDYELQQNPEWFYWFAKARQAIAATPEGKQAAQTLLYQLASRRHYYGFLAADELKQPYQFDPQPRVKPDLVKLSQKYPMLTLIKELFAIDWKTNATRDWYYLLNKLEDQDFVAVASLAAEWEQYHLAITTLGRGKKWDLLELRFPTPYDSPVEQAAKQHQVDPTWIYGIMRRESAFAEAAASGAGALGLMQLMPATAKYIARKTGIRYRKKQLTQPGVNIQLGAAYLGYLLDKFDGNQVLATASYNAGPNAVKRWLPEQGNVPAARWITAIPYKETRDYVKSVIFYMTIFQSLKGDHKPVSDLMSPILPKNYYP